MGVSFFFVLSGFLITYLLLEEKNQKGLISIKHFLYKKNTKDLAIIFFNSFILGFFILPSFSYVPFYSEKFSLNFYGNLIFYMLILPNFALSFYHSVPLIGQTWSIGVEEQFYLVWPILFRLKKIRFNFLIVLFFIWIFFEGFSAFFLFHNR